MFIFLLSVRYKAYFMFAASGDRPPGRTWLPILWYFMDADNLIEIIRTKAEQHHQRYPTFDLAVFLRWIGRQTRDWQEWAATQTIAALSRQRRCEAWANIQNAKRVRYTPEPVEDGPH